MAKASITRNYRFPTLNDLYFLPGGNPALNNESGFTYETGLSFSWIRIMFIHYPVRLPGSINI